ncbi:MAG: SDR family NAD(P)-dependent oxidoreductase [Proteobacteria bacterium]|nr:MAG: SDR family NAD(P)-dependent oxidoreductase [Pseudomonadota bacterium]
MLTRCCREQGRVPQQGSIVNAASVNSIQSGAGTSGYTAAKHGVVGITKAVRQEETFPIGCTRLSLTSIGMSRGSWQQHQSQRCLPRLL